MRPAIRARRPVRSRSRTDAADERGFTVVEVIVTVALIAVVLVPMLTTLVRANETARYTYDRNGAIDDLRVMINDVAKDLRQATAVTSISDTSVTVSTYVQGTSVTVTWRVPTGTTQLERIENSGASRVYVVNLSRLTEIPIFTANADDTRITVDLGTQPDPRHPELRITTEVELRNAG